VSELLNGHQEVDFSRTLLNHGILNSVYNFFKLYAEYIVIIIIAQQNDRNSSKYHINSLVSVYIR